MLPGLEGFIGGERPGPLGVVGSPTSGRNSTSARQTSTTATLPDDVISDERLLLFIILDNSAAAPTIPGWTQVITGTNSSLRLAIFERVADGSEGSSVVISHGSAYSAWICTRVGSTLGATEAATPVSGVNPPSLSPSWGSASTLWFAIGTGSGGGGSGTITGDPTGYTNLAYVALSGSNNNAIRVSWKLATAPSDDPSNVTEANFSLGLAGTSAVH